MNKQSKIQAKYDKTHTRRINLKLNLELDADILQKLNSVDSMQGYIKDLIRADLVEAEFVWYIAQMWYKMFVHFVNVYVSQLWYN